jgi:DNA-binding NarL/FixJ family response regulator
MTRILVIDDSEAFRRALRPLIEAAVSGAVIGEAAHAEAALAALDEAAWEVALLDLSLRGRSGFEVLRELRRRAPTLRVVVMSLHSEAEYGPAARAAGAAGYLDKAEVARTIGAVIAQVQANARPWPREAPASASREPAAPPAPDDERRHLARALHDDIGQALIAAKLELQLGAGEPEAGARQRAAAARAILDAAIGRVRELAAGLRLDPLDELRAGGDS